MKTKILLFVGIILSFMLASCGSIENAMHLTERAVQVGNAYEQQARYIRAQSPYQRSDNGTNAVYSYNGSTCRSLSWVNRSVENRGGWIYVYATSGKSKRLIKKMPKGYHDSWSTPVLVRNPYYRDTEQMTLQIVTIPGNVFVYLKRGMGNLESYSMR